MKRRNFLKVVGAAGAAGAAAATGGARAEEPRDDTEFVGVLVDTTLKPGSLSYGECVLPGESDSEVLLSTHVCHPSMANDNLSGIALLAELGRILSTVRHRYTYRLLFIPGTIGALTWLARGPVPTSWHSQQLWWITTFALRVSSAMSAGEP